MDWLVGITFEAPLAASYQGKCIFLIEKGGSQQKYQYIGEESSLEIFEQLTSKPTLKWEGKATEKSMQRCWFGLISLCLSGWHV